MSQTVPSTVPQSFYAGDTVKWQIALQSYPATEGWQLHYTLNKTGTSIKIDGTSNGSDHLISVSSTVTSNYAAGKYRYVAWVDGVDSEQYTIDTGEIEILPNLAAQTSGYDTRSAAKKCLDELDAALAIYGKKAYTLEYSIGDRRMKFATPAEFMAFRKQVKAEVNQEKQAENIKLGKPSGSKVLLRF